MFYYFILIFIALIGFSLSFYIYRKKRLQQTLVCPLKLSCDTVVHSDYSKFFGIPVEIIGLIYYGLIVVAYASFLFIPEFVYPIVIFGFLIASALAFLFSLYLTFIQAVILKQWCTWCLISAFLCVIIFTIVFYASSDILISLLSQNNKIILILHVLGVSLGFGGAIITDVFFFKFLKSRSSHRWICA